MEFKIDTKNTFTIIMPANGTVDANLTGELGTKVEEMRQSGSYNFVIDFQNCVGIDKTAVQSLISLHEDCYGLGQSLVYTGISKSGMAVLKENECDLLINVAPSMQEAIDIISMEILERDLFSEE